MLTVLLYGVFYNESFSSTHSQFKNKSQEKVIQFLARQGWSPWGVTQGLFLPPTPGNFQLGRGLLRRKQI